jgi:hypothetical protein
VFSEFMTDILFLEKLDGRSFENVRACVSGKGILIEDVSLPIEYGDKLTRTLPNGLAEEFIVDDPGFHQAFAGMQPHFQVRVHKAGVLNARSQPVTYKLSGPNARVNINSRDHSTNTATFGPAPVFAELRKALDEVGDDDRAKLIAGIEAMEKAHRTPNLLTRYTDFIALAANHMTIVAPFLPALARLVTGQP